MAETAAAQARIEDYALIGDGHSAALINRTGALEWLCWPRFDSPACFAALLGGRNHGRWLIAPRGAVHTIRRAYRGFSLVLETIFATDEGEVAVIDFMPPNGASSSVIRLVAGRAGRVSMRLDLTLRFDYGTTIPWVTRLADGNGIRAIAGPDMVVLRTPVTLLGQNLTTIAEFEIAAGETIPFMLTHSPSHLPPEPPHDPLKALAETERFWADWSSRCLCDSRYREPVLRSLITLKALIYAPTGGIVAAPTTSLPEQWGGSRNWDYRYCWLRDATLTLDAMMAAGYYEEAEAWRNWLHRAIAGSPAQVQIMYGLAGERRLMEWEATWLPGFAGSRPVRIGNAASDQLQLDVYGEVMDSAHTARRGGLGAARDSWPMQRKLLEHLARIWDRPDEGLWEVRGGRRHFTFSKVMAWVAFDRAVKDAETYHLAAPLERWTALRDHIHATVCRDGIDPERQCFVQSFGSRELDASLLLIPMVGFLPPEDPRVRATVAAIERDLMEDGLVLRYRTEAGADGLPPGEGAFLACSFWMVDNLVLQGRREEARAMFDRLLDLRNDVGLLAEEYDPHAKRQLGNFPQAFSHLALVRSALMLAGGEDGGG